MKSRSLWGPKEAIASLKKRILRKWTARKYLFLVKTIRLYFKEFGEDVEEVLKNRTNISEMARMEEELFEDVVKQRYSNRERW